MSVRAGNAELTVGACDSVSQVEQRILVVIVPSSLNLHFRFLCNLDNHPPNSVDRAVNKGRHCDI